MGKHHRSSNKSSATSNVQQLRAIIARVLADSWNNESTTQLKQWLMKYLPSFGQSTPGNTAWRDIRDSISLDAKLMEKLCCVFQDARDCSLILLMSQLFTELISSKRAAKQLVQSGITLAVLCQIRVCCCLTSNSVTSNSNNNAGSWQSVSCPSDSALAMSLSLSAQCSVMSSNCGADITEKQSTSLMFSTSSNNNNNNSNTLQCSASVAIALHQLACRVFPLDSRYNTKARATGAILGTLAAAKTLFCDKKALPILLCALRFYLTSTKNLKLLGQNGAVNLLLRLIGSLMPRQTRVLKLAVELLASLLKSPSNCIRLVQSGGVTVLTTTLEAVHRSDTRCRQLAVRRLVLRCMLMVTQIKAGRLSILQNGSIQILYTISRELPARQELDGMYLIALGIIKQCAGPRRLPVSNLHSPYSFESTSHFGSELARSLAAVANRTTQKSLSSNTGNIQQLPVPLALPSSATQRMNAANPGGSDVESISDDEVVDADDDYAEETDFVANCRHSFRRNDSTEERQDGCEVDGGMTTGGETGGDDSDSDCGAAATSGYLAASSQNDNAATIPLESDPVVLASYDMFFPEIRDLSLTNTALSSSFSGTDNNICVDNLTAIINGTSINLGNNNNSGSNSLNATLFQEESTGVSGLRSIPSNTSISSNNSGAMSNTSMQSPHRKHVPGKFRLSTGGKSTILSRRSSELNVLSSSGISSESTAYYNMNSSAVGTSVDGNKVASLLPISLIGEQINIASMDRSSAGPTNSSSIGGFSTNRDVARYQRIVAACKRVAIWNKIAYPDLHGFLPYSSPEPQLAMPGVNIRRVVLADCDRFLQKAPGDIIGEIVYDLDAIVASHIPTHLNNSGLTGQQSQALGNDDLQRIGRSAAGGESSLQFNSLFECGNLRRAIRVREFEYDLVLTPDVSTDHHLQWFYFEVFNTPPACQPIRFNILNCEKPKSQYEKGMQVLAFSVTEAALGRPYWRRVGTDVCYYKNYLQHPSGPLPVVSYYTMSFTMTFQHSYDVCYLAYHYPYTYTSLLYELELIQSRVLPSDVYYNCQTLCMSENSNSVPIITITSSLQSNANGSSLSLPGIPGQLSQSVASNATTLPAMHTSQQASNSGSLYRSQTQRPYVILTSRVHPGETNSSYLMRGVLAFLLSDTQSARRARQSFVFKIVPMLNVDGVVNGNHRCSLYGDDLNRSWTRPSAAVAPSIFHTKRLLAWLRFRRRPILSFVDFHGHSRKKNVFVLGCNPSQSWRRRDVANPAVDPVTGEEDSRWRLLPVLLAATSPAFCLQDCCFIVERAKEPTARVVMWRQVGLIATYTLEATFCGFDQGSYRGLQVNPLHLQEAGADLCRCFEPLFASMGRCPTPNTRYNDAVVATNTSISAATGTSSFTASSATTSRLVIGGRNIGIDNSSSGSSSRSSTAGSIKDDNSDDDVEEPARRTTFIATKTIAFVTRKF